VARGLRLVSGGDRPRGRLAPRSPFLWVQLCVIGAFLILVARLYELQIHHGELYYKKSADNFVKELELPAPRGVIRDRQGKLLAENRPAYHVVAVPRFFTDEALQRLAKLLHLDDEEVDALKAKVASRRGLDRFRPTPIIEDVERDAVGLVESHRLELPGVSVISVARRWYPNGALAAHVVGFMNQVTAEELQAARREREGAAATAMPAATAERDARLAALQPGDFIGRAGLERQWESFLRGKDGVERVVVDAKGQQKLDIDSADLIGAVSGVVRDEPQPGLDLVTTLDVELQAAVEKALKKHPSGAAVVVEVETGRILAMASWPAFDPNRMSGRLTRGEADALLKDPGRPLIDKTVREHYFPGSTFKIVPALAALTDHLVDVDEKVPCHGSVLFGKRHFHCVEAHGKVNLHSAIAESCNVYFYGLGERVGLDRMERVALDLGFGAPTGLGLNGEVAGVVPNLALYKSQGGGFQKGSILNTAIGQGEVKATVLQVAMAYAALANGGRLWVPQLIERIEAPGPDGVSRVVETFAPRLRRRINASPEDLRQIRAALFDAVNDPKGTGWSARVPLPGGVEIAGKTGTAQVGNKRVRAEGTQQGDHAWFASFAPARAPEIAMAVIIEHAGFGAKSATPVTFEIVRAYLELKASRAASAAATGAKEAAE
jgi:penicillin-binding protein 2